MLKKGLIVILNGASCAGKSSICSQVGELGGGGWTVLSKDEFKERHWVPRVEALYRKLYGSSDPKPPFPLRCDTKEKISLVNQDPKKWIDIRQFCAQHPTHTRALVKELLVDRFVEAVIAEHLAGRNVIVDRAFASDPAEFVGWLERLRGFPVVFVRVDCPEVALEKRLLQRGDRSMHLVAKHLKTVFSFQSGSRSFRKRHDIILKSNGISPRSLAQELLLCVDGIRSRAFCPREKWRMAFELNYQLANHGQRVVKRKRRAWSSSAARIAKRRTKFG